MSRHFLLFIIFLLPFTGFSQDIEFYNLYFDGNEFFAKEEYNKAIENYNKAIEMQPDIDYLYFNRGNAKFGLKNFKGAMLDYNQTIIHNGEYAEAYYQRALAKFELGNSDGACDDMKKARKLNCPGANDAVKEKCK